MSITSLSGVSGTQASQSIQNVSAKLQAAVASLTSGTSVEDSTDISLGTQLQSQTAALREISGNLTQAESLAQVANGGVSQIQSILVQLQSVAAQAASPTLNSENRKQLNQQFQQLAGEIDNLAESTSFNGQTLLNGNLSGSNGLSLDNLLSTGGNTGGNDLSISDLSSNSLFGGQNLNISSASGAATAQSVLGNAINTVDGVNADIGSFQQTLDFAAANVDTALSNQQAAGSQLTDTDFATTSTQASLADIQQNAAVAVAAQGNKLSPTLLQLLG